MRLSSRALTVLVLAVVGVGSWWWLKEQREQREAGVAQRHPDSYFVALDVVRHDERGNPELQLNAEYAEHFENEPWIHLRHFDATGLTAESDWRLRADAGRLSDDGVHLNAQGNVVLGRAANAVGDMTLRTEQLSINTDTQIAETRAPVTISQGNSRISGRGLWASLDDDRVRLESEVRAHYEK